MLKIKYIACTVKVCICLYITCGTIPRASKCKFIVVSWLFLVYYCSLIQLWVHCETIFGRFEGLFGSGDVSSQLWDNFLDHFLYHWKINCWAIFRNTLGTGALQRSHLDQYEGTLSIHVLTFWTPFWKLNTWNQTRKPSESQRKMSLRKTDYDKINIHVVVAGYEK